MILAHGMCNLLLQLAADWENRGKMEARSGVEPD